MVWLQLATEESCGRPSPCWGVEENGKKTGKKLVGRDKGSLTEQQTKGTGTTTIQVRRKHNTVGKTDQQGEVGELLYM